IEDSRTFVPVRFVSEALNSNVLWNGVKREVTILNLFKLD
ncbi:MAG: copper amine oxidase N-terminal domain-containing protein, partial [Caldiserica bacterium]|nr:copper amine oxidase N-terminal domain-containing protein [Caldisericota bacterium]